MLRKNAIKFYTTENSDTKASVVERFNRTLKSKMWKYFTYKNNQRYIDVLQDHVHSYNNTYHRSINMTPIEVNVEKEDYISKRLYGHKKQPPKWKYVLGDKVRISKAKQTFKKGYLSSWSDEIFGSNNLRVERFEWCEDTGKVLRTRVTTDFERRCQVEKVEKVLKIRKRGGKREYFVKWKGYDSLFNSWTTNIFNA